MSPDDQIATRLTEWTGCLAQVWDYTASLSTLRLKLSAPEAPTCAVLRLHGCTRVEFREAWSDFNPRLDRIEGGESLWRVSDGANLSVECAKIQLSEHLANWTLIPDSPLE